MLAGVCWLGMGLLVPFYVAVIGAIVIVGLIAEAIAARKIEWRNVGLAALAGLIAAPPLIYTFIIVATDPIWNVWANQLVILSPHPLHYLLGYGLIGVFAIIGLVKTSEAARDRSEIDRVAAGRAAVDLSAVQLAAPFDRRLADSAGDLSPPIGLVYGVLPAWSRSRLVKRLTQHQRYTVHGLRSWFIAGVLFLSVTTYVLMLVEQTTRMIAQVDLGFRDGAEVAALRWLDQRVTAEDVILSSYNTGNFLPVLVGAKAFLGHGPETAYSEAEASNSSRSFTTAPRRMSGGASSCVNGPSPTSFLDRWKRRSGNLIWRKLDYLKLVYDQNGYRIYRVVMPNRMMQTRNFLQRYWPILVLIAAPLVLFAPILIGRVWYWGVPLLQFYPWQRMAAESYQAGQLPLWNSLVGNGAPLAANLQTGAFYPLNFLYLLLPTEYAMGYTAILHVILAGLFMYAYLRTMKLSMLAALIGALAFELNGFLIARAGFFSVTAAVPWLAAWLWRAEKLHEAGGKTARSRKQCVVVGAGDWPGCVGGSCANRGLRLGLCFALFSVAHFFQSQDSFVSPSLVPSFSLPSPFCWVSVSPRFNCCRRPNSPANRSERAVWTTPRS